jgi:hypothetical protein
MLLLTHTSGVSAGELPFGPVVIVQTTMLESLEQMAFTRYIVLPVAEPGGASIMVTG